MTTLQAIKRRERLHVQAFRAIFKHLRKRAIILQSERYGTKANSKEEDFVDAIVTTSDDAFGKLDDEALLKVEQWAIEYDTVKSKKEE